jgi:hypothetical protein
VGITSLVRYDPRASEFHRGKPLISFYLHWYITSVAGCIVSAMVIHYKRNNSLGIGMPMYNKGCDCLEIALLFVFEVRYPLPTSLQLGHARVLSSLALRLFHTPLSSFQTQIAKQSSDADPISYYSLLAGLYVRSRHLEHVAKEADTCVPSYFKNQNPLKSWSSRTPM